MSELSDSTIESAGDAIITVDSTGTITSWNPAAERLLGHTRDEAIGQALALIIPPEHRAKHVAAFHSAMESGKLAHDGRPAHIEAMTTSGTVPFHFSLGLLPDAGGAIAVLRVHDAPIMFV